MSELLLERFDDAVVVVLVATVAAAAPQFVPGRDVTTGVKLDIGISSIVKEGRPSGIYHWQGLLKFLAFVKDFMYHLSAVL